jgi:hypothetical protein
MSTTPAAENPPAKFSVAEFIDSQLGMLQRRATPEERAQIRWFRDRVAILAKQQPAAEPVSAQPAHAHAA